MPDCNTAIRDDMLSVLLMLEFIIGFLFLKSQVMLTELLAVASSYPEPADAKLTPLLSCPDLNLGSRNPGILLAIPSFSAA